MGIRKINIMSNIAHIERHTQKRIVTLFYESKVTAILFFGIVGGNIRI
jgi:hypothetical protein